MLKLSALIAALILAPAPALAQRATGFAPSDEFRPNFRPTLEIRRAAGPIELDGDLSDAGWQGASRAGHFSEFQPGDNVRPPVETEAFLAYDENRLYVAFIAHGDPSQLRASLRDRDQVFMDDVVGVILDTYGDASSAAFLMVNPLGIQADLRFTPQGEDDSFDLIYESEAEVTPTGYQVEMAIPFSSLRFPDAPAQSWRLNLFRNYPRSSRHMSTWAALERDDSCILCQSGTLTGIEGVRPGGELELLPAVVASQAGTLANSGDPLSFANGDVSAQASLGLRYAFSGGWTAEATINPDFSQVESDAAQIDVNSTFALFFPERRPFFQEGSDLFGTWIDAVYTRSINDPVVATKLTGRIGRTSIGYIGARDEVSPVVLPFEERSAILQAERSTSNILRVRHSLGESSFIGGLATDRRLDEGGAGTAVGADALIRLDKQHQLELQFIASYTREPNDTALSEDVNALEFDRGAHTAAFDGEAYWGRAVYASLERTAELWSFDVDYWDATPTFRADNGFQTRNDFRRVIVWNGLSFYPKARLVDQVSPYLSVGRVWNFDGVRKDEWVQSGIGLMLKGQTHVGMSYSLNRERFRALEFDGIGRWSLNVSSRFSDPVSLGFNMSRGRSIARNLSTPVLGDGTNVSIWATVKPIQRLVIEPSYSYAELIHPEDGSEIFTGYVARTRVSYQFTRELFLRTVMQYNDFSGAMDVEPLLMYRLNPYSIVYVGSTHDFSEFDDPTGFVQTDRQFFLKLQYLFRR